LELKGVGKGGHFLNWGAQKELAFLRIYREFANWGLEKGWARLLWEPNFQGVRKFLSLSPGRRILDVSER